MAIPFDQKKALGILESFAIGASEKIMNYHYTNIWTFSNAVLNHIPTHKRNEFLVKLIDVFGDRGFGIRNI